VRPGSDAGVVRVPCANKDGSVIEKFLAFASDGNGRFVDLDPYNGGAMVIAEVCRNLVVTGAEPLGITDCLNFGSPENPVVMEQFARAIDGMADACRALGVPIVSGNVSLYNDTDGRPILPTPTVAAVGQLRSADDIVRSTFAAPGDLVLLLGDAFATGLGGSEYVAHVTGDTTGAPPKLDLAAEKKLQTLCLNLGRKHLARSMHDVSDGGLAVALSECCVSHDDERKMLGATLSLPTKGAEHWVGRLFGEAPTRVILTVGPDREAEVTKLAGDAGVSVTKLGTTGGDRLVIASDGKKLVDVTLTKLRAARESALEPIVGA
jgi:phosphoribosylformylglycinamidine synthase